jgi:hypothetical protein
VTTAKPPHLGGGSGAGLTIAASSGIAAPIKITPAVPAAYPTGGAPAGNDGHSKTDHQDPRRLQSQRVAVIQRHNLPKLILRFDSRHPLHEETSGQAAKLTLGQRHKNYSQNAKDRSPYQIPPWMRWDDSTDGPCHRQTPNLAPDGKDPASYSYQAKHNPNWAAPYADKLARAVPYDKRSADKCSIFQRRLVSRSSWSFNLQDQRADACKTIHAPVKTPIRNTGATVHTPP